MTLHRLSVVLVGTLLMGIVGVGSASAPGTTPPRPLVALERERTETAAASAATKAAVEHDAQPVTAPVDRQPTKLPPSSTGSAATTNDAAGAAPQAENDPDSEPAAAPAERAPIPPADQQPTATPSDGQPAAPPASRPPADRQPGAAPANKRPTTPQSDRQATSAKTLDLAGLEKRLRDTKAIGIFTKLSLKNQVDDLLTELKTYHRSRNGAPLNELRERYNLLMLKVLSLLQTNDPPLARDLTASREAIWTVLTDPVKFSSVAEGG